MSAYRQRILSREPLNPTGFSHLHVPAEIPVGEEVNCGTFARVIDLEFAYSNRCKHGSHGIGTLASTGHCVFLSRLFK